jgi:hypothetical protein
VTGRSNLLGGAAAAAAFALLLQGCGIFTVPVETPACPRVAVLADAARIVKFRPGAGQDLTDVLYEAQFRDIDGTCAYDMKKSHVDLEFTVGIEVARGPAETERRVNVDFFVAVVDPNQNILGKEKFTSNVRFEGNFTRAVITEDIIPRVPLRDVKLGPGYTVLIGFQLSPAELDYIRRRGR